MSERLPDRADVQVGRAADDTLFVQLAGDWRDGAARPPAGEVLDRIRAARPFRRLVFDASALTGWDSGLLTLLARIVRGSEREGVQVDLEGLPAGVRTLMALATAVPPKEDARTPEPREGFFARVGSDALAFVTSAFELAAFVGETAVAAARGLAGRARFRSGDLALFLQETGPRAVPIVALINFLVGVILAFVGIAQLRLFGAQVYVADLVGVAMVREMAAIMTGILMAGRTGAAFAAQLGTMQVNEEIDALRTLGVDPVEFLVLPRLLATSLMMPLLCLFGDVMGVLGGWLVAVPVYGQGSTLYLNRTIEAVGLAHLFVGLFMSLVFGALVALAGCLRGLQCGRSASAVGEAATAAVVTGIVSIIVATALITVMCDAIGI